jgi:hypothetical protein
MKRKLSLLERDTAAYFANLNEEEARDEQELERALAGSIAGCDFDRADDDGAE